MSMELIESILTANGFDKYIKNFKEHEVTDEGIQQLSEEDFDVLAEGKIGPRNGMINAFRVIYDQNWPKEKSSLSKKSDTTKADSTASNSSVVAASSSSSKSTTAKNNQEEGNGSGFNPYAPLMTTTKNNKGFKGFDDSQEEVQEEDEGEAYEIEKIIEKRIMYGCSKWEYLVKWKNYGEDENSWVSEDDMDCPEILEKFEEEFNKVLPLNNLLHGESPSLPPVPEGYTFNPLPARKRTASSEAVSKASAPEKKAKLLDGNENEEDPNKPLTEGEKMRKQLAMAAEKRIAEMQNRGKLQK